jgi:hypothetical protein
MDQTNRRSTPTETQPVLQHFFVLPNPNYESMKQVEIHLAAKEHKHHADKFICSC